MYTQETHCYECRLSAVSGVPAAEHTTALKRQYNGIDNIFPVPTTLSIFSLPRKVHQGEKF